MQETHFKNKKILKKLQNGGVKNFKITELGTLHLIFVKKIENVCMSNLHFKVSFLYSHNYVTYYLMIVE